MGTSRTAIRSRFYQLAKLTHPDTAAARELGTSSQGTSSFVEIRDAFELLMEACTDNQREGETASSARNAARGQSGAPREQRRQGSAGAARRERSLGEVLCSRLEEEPGAFAAVWEELRLHSLRVTGPLADTIFKAIARSHRGQEAQAMATALELFREGSRRGMIDAEARPLALVSLLSWCNEASLDCTFEVCNEVRDEDKTPEVLAALSATFSYFPSGASF